MQEEVAKHTEKIYKAIKNNEHGFGEKVREIAIEIGIIVFAVTLSIWLHSWSDQDRKSTRLNSSHALTSRMPSSA